MVEKKEKDIEFPFVRIDLYFAEPDFEQEPILEECWYDFNAKLARLSYLYMYKSPKKKDYITQTSHIKNGVRTLKNQYFSS